MKKVLILFGSRYRTSKDTSEKIRDFLVKKEIEVSLVNINEEEPSLSGFDGVLIGTGIKINRWTKRIKKFIKKHKKVLNSREFKFGFFVNCGTASQKEKISDAKRNYIDKKMQKIGLSYDIADAFGPIYDFSENSSVSNMSKNIMREALIKEEGWEKVDNILYDLRDMDQIKTFAENFSELF
ncbi:MAG: flavodoxin domain-containing protein [Candidatus Hermodarchaeota archaeon]